MSDVVLLNPARYEKGADPFLPQNLGLGYLAAVLEAGGHRVKIIDALALGWHCRSSSAYPGISIRGLRFGEIITSLPREARYLGMSVPFVNSMHLVRELALEIKRERPDITVVVGGISPSVDPGFALESRGIDYAVRGAGEKALLALVSGKDPSRIPGVVSRDFDNGRAEPVRDLDTLPYPARHLLPMEAYLKQSGRGRRDLRSASVLTSRGCPFRCGFCSIHHIYGHRWHGRSAGNVLEEIRFLVRTYGVRHIEFEDDNLTLDAQRAEELFDGLMRLEPRITWSTPNGTRIDTLDKRLLRKMKQSGCAALFLAIESGDPDILKRMHKQLDPAKVEEVVRICGRLGINTSGIFIVGYPGETEESFRRTVSFIRKLRRLGLVGVGASIAKAYPGTQLRRLSEEQGLLLDKKRYYETPALGDYVDIETPDFSPEDVYRRLNFIRKDLNPLRRLADRFGATGMIKRVLPQWCIDSLKKNLYRAAKI